jgi:hypothetical protein
MPGRTARRRAPRPRCRPPCVGGGAYGIPDAVFTRIRTLTVDVLDLNVSQDSLLISACPRLTRFAAMRFNLGPFAGPDSHVLRPFFNTVRHLESSTSDALLATTTRSADGKIAGIRLQSATLGACPARATIFTSCASCGRTRPWSRAPGRRARADLPGQSLHPDVDGRRAAGNG